MRKTMTLAEFLAWEERQELRYEFDGARVVDRLSGTAAHSTIGTNFLVAVHSRLRNPLFWVVGSNLKLLTGAGTIRYPDAMVLRDRYEPSATVVESAVVVLEVLSEETSRVDRIDKAREYEATPSVQRYVMLEQEAPQAVVYRRDGDRWTHDILLADAILAMPEIGVEFPLAELYEGLSFEAEPEPEPA